MSKCARLAEATVTIEVIEATPTNVAWQMGSPVSKFHEAGEWGKVSLWLQGSGTSFVCERVPRSEFNHTHSIFAAQLPRLAAVAFFRRSYLDCCAEPPRGRNSSFMSLGRQPRRWKQALRAHRSTIQRQALVEVEVKTDTDLG